MVPHLYYDQPTKNEYEIISLQTGWPLKVAIAGGGGTGKRNGGGSGIPSPEEKRGTP